MASQGFKSAHYSDENGNPAGGESTGIGIDIAWQNGPLGNDKDGNRRSPNGAFVEDVIKIARDRIEYYQKANGGKFACRENAIAITKLEEAEMWLDKRTQRRVAAGDEGTHRGN